MRKIICLAGKNEIALNSAKFLLNELQIKPQFLRIIPNSSDTGLDSWQPSFKKFALQNGIKIISLENAQSLENAIFISLEFDKIIKPQLFKSKELFNLHFSLLPAYKGVFTAIFPLLNGESVGGVSFHKIDSGIDTGDIIAQKRYKIALNDTARDVYFKNLKHGFLLFKSVIKPLLKGEVKATPQRALRASYFARNSLDFANLRIDFNKTSFEIHNQIRAFIFKEYQLPEIDGFKIQKSILTSQKISTRKTQDSQKFTLSGIDGFKILAYKTGGGGGTLLNFFLNLKSLLNFLTKATFQAFLTQIILTSHQNFISNPKVA